jgi:TetR/AcrR family transcriptional regulator, cholesterol catabolism regulator
MPLRSKDFELRRSKILDEALTFFCERGYDNASLNDLITVSKISKGAFYHYFSSKEALVAAIADRLASQVFAELQPILNAPGLDSLARLNAFLSEASRIKADMAPTSVAVFRDLFRPENRSLYRQIAAAWEDLFRPALTTILRTGVKEKVFDTFDPEGVADLIQEFASNTYPVVASMLDAATEQQKKAALQTFRKRLRLHGIVVDRMLGLPDGSVKMLNSQSAGKIIKALTSKRPNAIHPGSKR